MTELARLLRAEGLAVVEVEGWRERSARGFFSPIGNMNHHTASRRDRGDAPSLGTVIHGRKATEKHPALPGPLCNLLIGRESGRVFVIAAGRANDSGSGSSVVLGEARNDLPPRADARERGLPDDLNGNPWWYDIEVENDGIGEPYAPVAIDSLVRTNAALCRAHQWSHNRCIQHREWTKRKPDMSWRGNLRSLVKKYLHDTAPQPPISIPKEEIMLLRVDGDTKVWLITPDARRLHIRTETELARFARGEPVRVVHHGDAVWLWAKSLPEVRS